ncbi:aspartyl-tRNA(Asn)/glutamyl-tRNA(Gln) amidotransferase subunit A [Rhizobium skierniewicense]|uniref:Aspartyl-tRNA(Asn)/glutamyl-tRNA(Gln) amidotransferase subunit A n=1 Tax=Rhizobium skierniewicense TaxID=984260 RepID=A0A7W6C3M7_9HYPH|nr:amidase [Rhizobium skierniewicense]MBB3945162.1 aspartyl-tRNA(Asn)/glutamyl-tRNA(Gln) amidotransferase subunit A [Rhizobium skierniewicense]
MNRTPPAMVVADPAIKIGHAFDPLELIDPGLADRTYRLAPAPDNGLAAAPVPSLSADLPWRTAGVEELLSAFAENRISPTGVLDELNDAIRSSTAGAEAVLRFVPGFEAAARDSETRWRNGTARPLEGIPFGVKDIIDVAGASVTSGSHFTGKRIAPDDAAVVARLRAAGAIPFAMTATTEFATGSPHNPRFGTVTNPWDKTRWTGGSSTGSGAGLAARLMPLALGTDTGGSIRVPSCWCGTTGLKPSRERVSRAGVAPLSWTLDHIGPMARSARDIARVLPFMTAQSEADLNAHCGDVLADHAVKGLRIGVPANWFTELVDDAVLVNWELALKTLEALGCSLVPLPRIDLAPWHEAGWIILQCELATLHSQRLDRAELFDPGLLHRLTNGLAFSAVDYARALQVRAEAQMGFLSAMADVDLVMTPGVGGEAGRLDSLTVDVNGEAQSFQSLISRNTMIFDVTGLPALMLPAGLGHTGLPTGIQIVGRPNADALCLRAGAAFQASTSHHQLSPPGLLS